MPSWGDTTLNIVQDSYSPPVAGGNINEIRILGNPETPDTPASVIQQGGRDRKTRPLDCWVASQAELAAFESDYYNGQIRTFTGHDGVSFDAVISWLSPARRVFEWFIEFSVTFMEATEE